MHRGIVIVALYKYASLLERFEAKIFKTEYCWIWDGTRSGNNYGKMWDGSRMVRAHRLSYEFYTGKIPKDQYVLHKCDNPPCVNPEHLFLGTYGDNIRDMVRKGRHVVPTYCGDACGATKISDSVMIEIYKKYVGGASIRSLSRQYGISDTAIGGRIKRMLSRGTL